MATENTINASAEDFSAAISNLKTCQQEFESAYTAMKNTVDQLESTWTGDAYTAFHEQFTALYDNLATSETTINKAVGDANFALQSYEENESNISNLFSEIEEIEEPPFSDG